MSAKPVVILCAVATLTLPLAAQDHARRVGVGISVPDIGVFLPINVGAHFRRAPYVDFLSARADYPVTSDTAWDSHTIVGLGVFSVAHPQERLNMYLGPRFGLLHGSTRVNGSAGQTSTTSSGWFIAGAIGGEDSPAPAFSVGAEAKIQYDHTSSSSSGSNRNCSKLYSRSWVLSRALFVRFSTLARLG